MNQINQSEDTTSEIISQHLDIQAVLWGNSTQEFIVKYQGVLTSDSETSFAKLENHFDPKNIDVFFRLEDNQHIIELKPKQTIHTPDKPKTNLLLFLLTLLSMVLAGAIYSAPGDFGAEGKSLFSSLLSIMPSGIPFAISLLAILTAHEFGHYFAAKYHKSDVSLPYFLPFPLSPFGTLGAFIRLKSHPRNRKVLHDIGVAGPLAGLIVTIPILFYGLTLSTLDVLPAVIPNGISFSLEGNSIFYLFSKYLVFGQLLPAPQLSSINDGVLYWITYIFTGTPTPLGGLDVYLHPVAWAAWAGLLVTSLNLIPVGQLDGGHILYVLLGEKSKKILPFVLAFLSIMGFVWEGWWLWVVLIWFTGRSHAQPKDQITELDITRKYIAIFMMVIFILIFMPIPLKIISG